MGFIEAKIPDDCTAVLDAAAVLDMREIDFFRLAFRRWFGRDVRDSEIERVFAAYMFRNIVPPWARHFSRHVLARAADGRLAATPSWPVLRRYHGGVDGALLRGAAEHQLRPRDVGAHALLWRAGVQVHLRPGARR